MKKYLIPALIIILVIIYFLLTRPTSKFNFNLNPTPTQEIVKEFAIGWNEIVDSGVKFKLEKNVNKGTRPQIVLIETQLEEVVVPAKYVDKLIAGAKSAIPSLKISSDKRESQEKYYSAVFTGTYINRNEKLNIIQQVYIKNNTVYVITATFIGDLTQEINTILNNIAKDKIL